MKFMARIFNQLVSRQGEDPTPQKTMYLPNSPATFFRDELDRALREQSFGIQSYKLGGSTPRQSSASVLTLEGLTLTIILTTQGYSVQMFSHSIPFAGY
jgi:hypothetical protein